ncbi:MAG: tetratricopeptide repeat protein [Phycisphaerales bacterium JB038]
MEDRIQQPDQPLTVEVRQEVALKGSMWQRGLQTLLERGDSAAVHRACVSALRRAEAGARLAAARAALRIGEWLLAVRLGRSLTRTTLADSGWTVIGVAAWAAGRSSLGAKALRRAGSLDRQELADLWLQAEGAMLLDRQRSPRIAGADPSTSLLEPLTSQALGVLDRAVARNESYADLHFHRGKCLLHLGLRQEASEELDRALRINPRYAVALRAQGLVHEPRPA